MTPGTSGSKGTIRVLQLYPRDMNIYGDWGNALVLQQRLKWHGYAPELLEYNPGDDFPDEVDLIVAGGGQDSGQLVIQDDLQMRADTLRGLAEDDAPMLVICGLYQLFGHFFKTRSGHGHSRHRHPGRGNPRNGRTPDRQRESDHSRVRRGPWLRKPQRPDHPRPGRGALGHCRKREPATTARTATRAPATATSWRATCTAPCSPRTRPSQTS